MRKRIGVFIGEIAQDYQRIVAQGVAKRANSLGYDTVFICSYGSYNEDILYAEGEKSCIHLPDCSTFNGIIVTEDVFDIAGMPDELYQVLQETAQCPIVYLRSSRDNCYSVLSENQRSIESMVRHFTDVHGFRDICYMSGKKEAEDAQERLQGYLNVMQEKGIKVTDNMVFHGDYWRYKGKEAIDWFMKGRRTYPQAIVCANDYMALSICEELKRRGVRVPQDVCVSGFDFLDEARVNNPSLTSLEVDFEGMVYRAVDIIDSVNHGHKEDRIQRVEAKLMIHKSCGCGKQYKYNNVFDLLIKNQKFVDDTKNTLLSVTDYQYSFDFDEYMAVADKYRRFARSRKAFLCLSDPDDSGFNEVENDSLLTKRMILKRVFEDDRPAEKLDIIFPRKKILPDEFWSEKGPNNFCVFTIHFKNIVHGYMVAQLSTDKWFDIHTQGYLMTLANAIENSEIHKKMEHLESIRAIYQNDALTGILNRRGFDKALQEKYSEARAAYKTIGICSIDMDNLKIINDTFGHAEGDRALIILAKALSSSLREGDICARNGGDEFAAVINVTSHDRCSEFKREFAEALKRESEEVKDKYVVDASVGICESTEYSASSLVACIQLADRRMYEEKRNKKVGRD